MVEGEDEGDVGWVTNEGFVGGWWLGNCEADIINSGIPETRQGSYRCGKKEPHRIHQISTGDSRSTANSLDAYSLCVCLDVLRQLTETGDDGCPNPDPDLCVFTHSGSAPLTCFCCDDFIVLIYAVTLPFVGGVGAIKNGYRSHRPLAN